MKQSFLVSLMGIVWLLSQGFWQAPATAAPLGDGITSRVSVATDGTQGNGPSTNSDISDDGRWVVFDSEAGNLVSNDTNGVQDVFLHDRQTGTTRRLSVNAEGEESNSLRSEFPAISGDGEWVAFYSWADHLVEGDTNGVPDLFLWERATNSLRRISVSSEGEQGTGYAWVHDVVLSMDGRYIVYTSGLEGLTSHETEPDQSNLFYHDRITGETQMIDLPIDGSIPNAESLSVDISADGRYVAFGSGSDLLVEEDRNGLNDIFVRDMQSESTEQISLYEGQSITNHDEVAISGDGRFVAFVTTADMTNGTNTDMPSIYVYDRVKGTMLPAVTHTNGERAQADSPQFSADGRFLVFKSTATLVPTDANPQSDIYRRDLQLGETEVISVSSYGEPSNDENGFPWMSADGALVVWQSAATTLVKGDTNGTTDIFVRENSDTAPPTRTPTPTITPTATATPRISPYPYEQFLPLTVNRKRLMDGSVLVNITAHGNGDSYAPVTSQDGSVVAFVSVADNLVPNDTNGKADIFVWERVTGQITRVSVSATGRQLEDRSERPAISEDGRYVVYTAWGDGVVSNDTNEKADIFRYDRLTGEVLLVSVALDGEGGDDHSVHADVSADGNVVVFTSTARNLNAGGVPGVPDRIYVGFVRNLTTSQTSLLRYNGSGNVFQFAAWPTISNDGTKVGLAVGHTYGICLGQAIIHIDLISGSTTTIASTSVSHHWEHQPNAPRISPDGAQVGYRYFSIGGAQPEGYFLNVGGNPAYNLVTLPLPPEYMSCGYFSGNTQEMSFSANGQRVAFTSADLQGHTPSVPGDTNLASDVFVSYRATQSVMWLSRSETTLGNGNSYDAYISGDGLTIYFTTDADNLVPNDTNRASDIMMWVGE